MTFEGFEENEKLGGKISPIEPFKKIVNRTFVKKLISRGMIFQENIHPCKEVNYLVSWCLGRGTWGVCHHPSSVQEGYSIKAGHLTPSRREKWFHTFFSFSLISTFQFLYSFIKFFFLRIVCYWYFRFLKL